MSSTDVQLRFAAEVSLFLVSLAGIGFAFLRADLLARRPSARWVATVGFLFLGVAAFASGALVIDDPSDGLLVGLRILGIALVSLASTAWRTDRGGRELLRIGMVSLIVAELAALTDKSRSVVDLARMLGCPRDRCLPARRQLPGDLGPHRSHRRDARVGRDHRGGRQPLGGDQQQHRG